MVEEVGTETIGRENRLNLFHDHYNDETLSDLIDVDPVPGTGSRI